MDHPALTDALTTFDDQPITRTLLMDVVKLLDENAGNPAADIGRTAARIIYAIGDLERRIIDLETRD